MTAPEDRTGLSDDSLEVSTLSSRTAGMYGSPLTVVDTVEAESSEEPRLVPHSRLRVVKLVFGSPKFVIGFTLFAVIVSLAILAPLVARYNPNLPDYGSLNQNPSTAHIMGTDYLGRDLWARLVWGGRLSLSTGVLIVLLAFCLGVPWGVTAGFGGRLIDDALMRLVDVLLAFPPLVLAFSVITILGTGQRSVVIAIGVASIPGYARVSRATTLSTKELDYVLAARVQGASSFYIMRRHVLKNVIDPLVILATLNLSGAVLAAAGLSFLGIGTQLPAADWGTMLANGYNYMFLSWSQVTFPAIVIMIWVLGINLMGDSLGEALNPRSRRR